jgi:aryl-alcohol dehydrogenase-like predicted oxidoreductase
MDSKNQMPTRELGRTGWQASVLTLGGVKWDLKCTESEAVNLIHRAYELGVNTFDTAVIYTNGESERRLGIALRDIRDKVFVSTKTTKRGYDEARRDMDASLKRLRTDYVDLMFVHSLEDDEDYRQVISGKGVLRAMEEYRAAGKLRYIGVSGHWYRHNLERIIKEYPFDVILVPVGLFNIAYRYSYFDTIIPAARQRGIGVMGMKVFGAGRVKHTRSVEPYLRYSLNQPIDSAVIGCDSLPQLEQTVRIVKSQPPPLGVEEQEALLPEAIQVTQTWEPGEFNWVSHYRR